MSRFDLLLQFCKSHFKIYCYGAGCMGLRTFEFLNKYGISIEGFIVSKKVDDSIKGIKIYQFDEVLSNINAKTGIILSLDKKHHEEIIARFLSYIPVENEMFFRITYEDVFMKMRLDMAEGLNSFSEKNGSGLICKFIDNVYDIELKKIEGFQEKYNEIHSRYKKIVFSQYDMRHIGVMCLTYYIWSVEREAHKDILYVMMPVLWDNDYNKVPNRYLFSKIQEKMEIITQENYQFWRWMIQYHVNEIEFSNQYGWNEIKERDMYYLERYDVGLDITLTTRECEYFNNLKISNGFVCIYSRDAEYYKRIGQDASTDSYRNCLDARNSAIEDFKLMAFEYNKKGLPLVRMGSVVDELINSTGIIDYANICRTEALDFYLISKCKFFVVSASGIMAIATLFDTPIVFVNAPIVTFSGDLVVPMPKDRDIIIMKRMWYPKQNRFLSFDEILYMEEKYSSYGIFDAYRKLGIEFQSNLPQELLAVSEEMRKRIEGNIVYLEEDESLQKKYRSKLEESAKRSGNHFYNGRFGADFLRNNQWFLDSVPDELAIWNVSIE